jgi:hypothetical protein
VIHLCVHALPLHEFLVGTLLGNPAPLHHDDLVGVNNGLEPVRNHQHGFPMEQDIQRPLNEIFILCVGKGCGFVQQNDGCVLEDRPCQRNALHLASG